MDNNRLGELLLHLHGVNPEHPAAAPSDSWRAAAHGRGNQPLHREDERDAVFSALPCHQRSRPLLILRRPLDMVDDEEILGALGGLELQPKLLW